MFLGIQNEKIKFYLEEKPKHLEFYPNVFWKQTQSEYILNDEGTEYIRKTQKVIKAQLIAEQKIKSTEALDKANEYINNGNALYEISPTAHIEATDGNISKLTAYMLAYLTKQVPALTTIKWTTKEDNIIELTQDDIVQILAGLGAVQAEIWNEKYTNYINEINNAKTIEEVKSIEIDYSKSLTTENEEIEISENNDIEEKE